MLICTGQMRAEEVDEAFVDQANACAPTRVARAEGGETRDQRCKDTPSEVAICVRQQAESCERRGCGNGQLQREKKMW